MSNTPIRDLGISVKDAAQTLGTALAQNLTFRELNVSAQNKYQVLPRPLELAGSHKFNLAGTALVLGGSAGFKVSAFNTADDKDPDGVVVVAQDTCWLKNELEAAITGSASGSVGSVQFGLEGELAAHLLDYRQQDPQAPVTQAVLDSIANARFATRWDDVRELAQGRGRLAYTVRGKLAFKASLSQSDVLAGSISALDAVLGVAGASAFQVDLGASISVDVSASDDFRLVFAPGTQDRISVEVKKAASRRGGLVAKLGVKVGFSDSGQLSTLIQKYLVGRLGGELQQLRDLLTQLSAAPNLENLGSLRPLAEQVARRLGITDLQNRFGELKQRLDGLEGKLLTEIKKVVEKKIELSFTLSYTRVQTHETVLSFEATPAVLEDHHPELLLGNLNGVTGKLARREQGFLLHEYLDTKERTSTRSFGTSLRIGDWAVGGTVQVEGKWREQREIQNMVRLNFDGRKSFNTHWLGDREEYAFELGAAMDAFAMAPTGRDFEYTMGLSWMWNQPFTPALLHDVLDTAHVWRILGIQDRDRLRREIGANPALRGKTVQVDLEMRLDDDAVRRLAKVAEPDLKLVWINAMAEALPPIRVAGDLVFRATLEERLRLYGRAAEAVFRQASGTDFIPDLRHNDQEERLEDIDLERRLGAPGSDSSRIQHLSLFQLWRPRPSDQVTRNNPAERCKRAFAALTRLREVAEAKRSFKDVEKVFEELQSLIRQDYLARLMGSVFAQILEGETGWSASGRIVPAAGGEGVVIG